jgi:hypothetical protein
MSSIIEINGIKMAVDERTATVQRVDTFRVGDPVKLLHKSYSSYEVKFGVIVGFDQFKARPTITIAYLDHTELKYCFIHQGSEHEMVAVESHDLAMEKTWILDRMKDRVTRKEQELAEEKSRMENFINMFGKYFDKGIPSSDSMNG